MSTIKNLIIEIGVEELPTDSLLSSAQSLESSLRQKLIEHQFLSDNQSQISDKTWVSPRRIACHIPKVRHLSQEQIITKRGPKHGTDLAIVEKFAKANGLKVDQLIVKNSDKGNYYFAQSTQKGKKIEDWIGIIIEQSLNEFASKKSMRWADFDYQFLRPIHSVLILHGNCAIKTKIFNCQSNNQIFAHRFHPPKTIKIDHEKNYESLLTKAKVMVDFDKRVQSIISQTLNQFPHCQQQINELKNYAQISANLVEWPVVLSGKIKQKYLDGLPVEMVENILLKHQFCFVPYQKNSQKLSLQKATDRLSNDFVFVANIESKNPNLVISGNEKVISARLEDGLFFYAEDCQKEKLEQFAKNLDKLVFHHQLGNLADKVERMQKLAPILLDKTQSKIDKMQLAKAIDYCKIDLLSQSVIEMPNLQGIIGAYLTQQLLESGEYILAIKEHYKPLSRFDDLPGTQVGQLLSLIDKLDSLIGLWLVGLAPSGSKDPFALRRNTLAIVRLALSLDLKLDIELVHLFDQIKKLYLNQGFNLNQQNKKSNSDLKSLAQFVQERAVDCLTEQFDLDLIQASMAKNNKLNLFKIKNQLDFFARHKKQLNVLSFSYKRIYNLLKNQIISIDDLDFQLLTQPLEKQLLKKISTTAQNFDLTQLINYLLSFETKINQYLDKVQINCLDQNLAKQRKLLLAKIKAEFDKLPINLNHLG